ncbi:MAG: hypothetical protein L3J68_01895 [Thermoplasmata archaeon]|nr:hypothetical protein [Thermoplasmata archaeon]
MSTHQTTPSDSGPADSTALPEELNAFYRAPRPTIVAVLARAGPERFALTAALIRAMTCPGVIVATRDGAGAYRTLLASAAPQPPGPWTVLEGGNSEGGVQAVARALAHSRDLIAEPELEEALSALWLPAHILEAFGLLPADGSGLVILDSWDGLLAEYLPDVEHDSEARPTVPQLEKILARTLRKYAQALLIVIVDSASRSEVAHLADGVIEVVTQGQFGVLSGSLLITRGNGNSSRQDSLRFHLDGGTIRWHSSR